MAEYPGTPLRRGARGPAVIELQKALGLGPGDQTGLFGPLTEELAVSFQKAHGLEPDGIVGPLTWVALFRPRSGALPPGGHLDLGKAALAHALRHLQVREAPLGSNRGPEVDDWNRRAGAPVGSFWCMAFVHAMVQDACRDLGLEMAARFPRTASCSFLYRWARERDRLVAHPQVGDVFLCIGGETGHYHTGLVSGELTVAGRFPTVEGNSNAEGSANGIGVFHRKRGRRLASCHYVAL